MGAAASTAISEPLGKASAEDLQAAIGALSEEERAKLKSALDKQQAPALKVMGPTFSTMCSHQVVSFVPAS